MYTPFGYLGGRRIHLKQKLGIKEKPIEYLESNKRVCPWSKYIVSSS